MRQSNAKVDPTIDGHAIRSSETRAKMIEAAIEVFGTVGYEAASTRVLVERAGVNLAAIPYHFGGKRKLYIAAAQSLADYARKQVDPIIAHLRDAETKDPVVRIDEAVSSFFHLIVGGPEPQAWVTFFVRCEHDADDAFRIIYNEVIARFERALKQTVAEAAGCDATDETLRMQVALVLASIISFRALRNTTLRILGWDEFNPSRLRRLDMTIKDLARSEFFSSPAAVPACRPAASSNGSGPSARAGTLAGRTPRR
jgi:AcrR family transcriptional regulator